MTKITTDFQINHVTDIHMHIVPGVDDGAVNLQMSLDMLEIAYKQGVRKIYCTSHNGYCVEDNHKYLANFQMLQICARSRFPDVTLLPGCELLCSDEYMDDIIYGLEKGAFSPMGNSNCLLTELYPDSTPAEAHTVADKLLANGWKPIFAHMERYPKLFSGNTINDLIHKGCLVQVNAYSFADEKDEDCRRRARHLLDNRYIHFIGSDAHRTNHRPPNIENGISFIFKNVDKEYAEALCTLNSQKYL